MADASVEQSSSENSRTAFLTTRTTLTRHLRHKTCPRGAGRRPGSYTSTMDSRSLDILEFPKVLDRVAAHASFSLGKARVHALRPTRDLAEAERRQVLTQEARRLLDLRPHVTIGGARDVGDLVRRAALGGRLEASDL